MSDKDIKATKTSNNIVRSFIKVKQEDGSFTTLLPVTNSSVVIGASGKTVDVEIADIQQSILSNTSSIKTINEDTKELAEDVSSFVNYANPLIDEFKSHIQDIETGEEFDDTIFDHIYEELDTLTQKITEMDSKMSDVVSKLEKVIVDTDSLAKLLTNLASTVEIQNKSISELNTKTDSQSRVISDISTRIDDHEDEIL